MKVGERIFLLFFIIFSLVLLKEGSTLPAAAKFGIGPGFLPKVVSILSIILSAALLVRSFLQKDVSGKKFGAKEGLLRMAVTFGLLVLAVFLMDYVGMVIPLVLFLIIEFRWIEKYKLFTSIKVSVFSVAVFYAIFKLWLGVPIEII